MGKNVALVLGSGGARGLAHIGAIEALEEKGYTITSIAGLRPRPFSLPVLFSMSCPHFIYLCCFEVTGGRFC